MQHRSPIFRHGGLWWLDLHDIGPINQMRRGVALRDESELQCRDIRLRRLIQDAGRLERPEALLCRI